MNFVFESTILDSATELVHSCSAPESLLCSGHTKLIKVTITILGMTECSVDSGTFPVKKNKKLSHYNVGLI